MALNQNDSRDVKLGRTLKTIGILLMIIIVLWFMFFGRLLVNDTSYIILSLIFFSVFFFGFFLFRRGKQHVARSISAESSDDKRPPVVYLRAFQKDTTFKKDMMSTFIGGVFSGSIFTKLSPIEEQMAVALKPIGPFVALAHPGKTFPVPGVESFHADNEEWKSLVIGLLHKARLVIIQPGGSESVLWEIEQAFNILKPSQLLLFYHNYSKKDYENISGLLEKSLGIILPKLISRKPIFIAFSENWKARALTLKAPYWRSGDYKKWKYLINHTLEPVFHDLNVEWHPSPISFV